MEPFGLPAWVERIRKEELPIFGRTAIEVARLTERPSVPVSLLANVVLQDASMTTRLLRMANSAFYPKGSQVTTISRAITLLGFEVVRGLCLSVGIIDSLLKEKPREQLLIETGRAFYAAALARMLAKARNDELPEEVFVAGLLYRLGEFAFWCFGGRAAEKLEALLEDPNVSRVKAEQTLLGFRLPALTVELVRLWKLGSLLTAALTREGDSDSRAQGIVLSHQLAALLHDDADSIELTRLIKQVCRYTNLSTEAVEEMVADASKLASDIAKRFGADIAVPKIPGQTKQESPAAPAVMSTVPPGSDARYPEPDPLLQLKILRELVMSAENNPDTDLLLQLALEGMYRGVGMDRAVFLALSPDIRKLYVRFALAADSEMLIRCFNIDLCTSQTNIFYDCLANFQSVWAPLLPESERAILSPEVLEIVQRGPFIITPVRVHGAVAGVFYGDRLLSQRQLDSESSESFELFAFQVNQILQR